MTDQDQIQAEQAAIIGQATAWTMVLAIILTTLYILA